MITRIINYVKLSYLFLYVRKQRLKIRERKRWKRAFLYFLNSISKESSDYLGRWNVLEGFAKSDIIRIQKAKKWKEKDNLILICVMLNEKERIEVFLNHYRKIGVRRFVILDNGSTDGTVEYLKKQPDVELFQTKDKFESKRKMGWINRLISYYGNNYWYLVVDADELLVWKGVEETCIQDATKYFDKESITRVRALMVDMYPMEMKWNSDESFNQIYPKCIFFDYNTYYHQDHKELYLICGGPRKRMLGVEVWLTKYPLFRLKEKEILCNPHTIYPYKNKKSPCYLAVLHYKFVTHEDQRKMQEYARKGNYACNSAEYKLYTRKYKVNANNFNFFFDCSAEYQSSKSLEMIKEIRRIPL